MRASKKQSTKNVLTYAEKWLDIIKSEKTPTKSEADWMIDESLLNFREHFNAGWLDYRK